MTDTAEITGPGVYLGIENEAYHAGPGISKSGLWTLYSQTPAHFRYPPEKEPKKHFDFGQAVDLAILEPENFGNKVMRGPEDRRGNQWKAAEAEATNQQKLLLTQGDFDKCLMVREAIHANSFINKIITGGVVGDTNLRQTSAYWIDESTGLLCKCRPDLVRTDLGVMFDLKTARSAAPRQFASAVSEYGYHAQEAWYTEGWAAAGEKPVTGFLFLAVEKESPFAFKVYELKPSAVAEGAAAMRLAMDTYADCMKRDTWPAYGEDVAELGLPGWAFKLTENPKGDEE